MSDESAPQESTPAKRRGRPPGPQKKTRKRHELTTAPIDGDYAELDVVNKDPAYHYVAMSNRDRGRRGHRYEVCRWEPGCPYPPFSGGYKEELRGQEIKIGNGELTLMRIPVEQDRAFKQRELNHFRALKNGIAAADRERGHDPQREKRMVTHNIPVAHIYT